ncbi:hypothetical protein LCGC14_2142170 [marine sediment metagenome]|uniref:Uncharacterized protein n=1 Tax=marine sediment metagenome TaxID=412755 RepID=A0A0F9EK98_9ZZZZ
MKKQITFEGTSAQRVAIEWLLNLAKCFDIKKVIITKLKQPYYWKGDKIRVVVRYD